MDLLIKTGAVKLRSHLEKFLVGDEDNETVRQSRNGSSRRAIWVVEPCPHKEDAVRFKNLSSGLYLTASDNPFLLGMTGKRVVQLSIFDPSRVEWEPISDGFQLKFRSSKEGKYLRANGGTPPWRNAVTYDTPLTGGTHDWILWDVEPVSLPELGSFKDAISPLSSFSSVYSDDFSGSYPSSPLSMISPASFTKKKSGMDLFYNAKSVRLKSHHDKYLIAEEDEESVSQDRNGSARNARWVVEFVQGSENAIRLKSCYGKYLTASNQPFLLGMTGRKVLQTMPTRLDSSIEWEPTKDGSQVRLKTRYGNYLRANGGLPPWRNSITHDVPHRTATKDWVLWEVDILSISDHNNGNDNDINYNGKMEDLKTKLVPGHGQVKKVEVAVEVEGSFGSDMSSVSNGSEKYSRQESTDSGTYSPPKHDGRIIYYHIADEYGGVDDVVEGISFTFKGHSVAELTEKLEEETGLEDIIVCTRSPLNRKLYPLRLQLPPNNTTMHVVVVPSTSRLAEEFTKVGIS